MANKTLNTRIVVRNDTSANWATNKTKVLLKGEIGLETDTHKYKIGDGSTTWENLTYYKHIADGTVFGLVDDVKVDGTSVVSSKIASLSTINGDYDASTNKLATANDIKTINGDYNASTNKLATEADLPTQASDVGALPDSTKYGAGLSVSGTSVQLLDQDGNNLGTAITTQDTGATSVVNVGDVSNTEIYRYYTEFTRTDDYVGFNVTPANFPIPTTVTYQNKDTLGIIPGTTIAYTVPNGSSQLTYRDGDRTIQNTFSKRFVGVNDVENALSTTSRNPVQNKVIAELIPSQASSSNQLADKSFVNSSISTATATFRGTYNVVSDLSLTYDATEQQIATALAGTVSTADNNDYCFVQIPTATATPTEIARIDRYKYNGTAWSFEYSLNNSGYTSAQWAAINSGLSSADKTKLDGIEAGAEVNDVTDVQINSTSILTGTVANFVTNTAYDASTNKIATMSDLPTDTGATSVGLHTGDTGNVITNMTYDATTRKITFEKGITAITDISGKQDKNVGSANAGKILKVDSNGDIAVSTVVDANIMVDTDTFILDGGNSTT